MKTWLKLRFLTGFDASVLLLLLLFDGCCVDESGSEEGLVAFTVVSTRNELDLFENVFFVEFLTSSNKDFNGEFLHFLNKNRATVSNAIRWFFHERHLKWKEDQKVKKNSFFTTLKNTKDYCTIQMTNLYNFFDKSFVGRDTSFLQRRNLLTDPRYEHELLACREIIAPLHLQVCIRAFTFLKVINKFSKTTTTSSSQSQSIVVLIFKEDPEQRELAKPQVSLKMKTKKSIIKMAEVFWKSEQRKTKKKGHPTVAESGLTSSIAERSRRKVLSQSEGSKKWQKSGPFEWKNQKSKRFEQSTSYHWSFSGGSHYKPAWCRLQQSVEFLEICSWMCVNDGVTKLSSGGAEEKRMQQQKIFSFPPSEQNLVKF